MAGEVSYQEENELQQLIEKDKNLRSIYISLLSVTAPLNQLTTHVVKQAYLKHLARLK